MANTRLGLMDEKARGDSLNVNVENPARLESQTAHAHMQV